MQAAYPGISLPGAIKNNGWVLIGTAQHVSEFLIN